MAESNKSRGHPSKNKRPAPPPWVNNQKVRRNTTQTQPPSKPRGTNRRPPPKPKVPKLPPKPKATLTPLILKSVSSRWKNHPRGMAAFATKNNQHLTWKDANNAVKNPPASQNLQQKKSQQKYNNNAKNDDKKNKQNDNNDNIWSQYKDRNNGCEPDNAYQ
eukprot:157402_1